MKKTPKDYRHKYEDLRFALTWAEECKKITDENNTPYGLSEAINITYGYLKSYCDTIKLEDK